MTADLDTLKALRERVREAKGADRQLDEEIGRWLWDAGHKPWECFDYGPDGPGIRFTASLDAALALVERIRGPGEWSLSPPDGARLFGKWPQAHERGNTPALALLAALLSALIAEKEAGNG